jgi:hypothetical protein
LKPEVLGHLKGLGVRPETAALTLRDAELLHLARDTKAARGWALSMEDLLDLPRRLARAPGGAVGPRGPGPGLCVCGHGRPEGQGGGGASRLRSADAGRDGLPEAGAQCGMNGCGGEKRFQVLMGQVI